MTASEYTQLRKVSGEKFNSETFQFLNGECFRRDLTPAGVRWRVKMAACDSHRRTQTVRSAADWGGGRRRRAWPQRERPCGEHGAAVSALSPQGPPTALRPFQPHRSLLRPVHERLLTGFSLSPVSACASLQSCFLVSFVVFFIFYFLFFF